jgi:hypothetical protein
MSKRFDNKRLLYLLAGLIAVLFLTVVIRIPKEKATLKSRIIEFDTLEVSKIIIYPRTGNGNAIEFNRSNVNWTVQQGTIVSATQKGAVQNIFSEVLNIKPQSLAAMNKSKWKEFELTDSLATHIKFLNKKGKTLADLMIGKFTYKQVDNPYGGYNPNNIQGTSFVRLYNEEEVYGVEGFISFLLSGKFEDWRDKSFIRSNQKDITNISFSFPADSSYKLNKKDSIWYAGNQIADSLNVANFLNTLGYLNGQNFKDNYKPVLSPAYQLLIEGNNLLNFSVKCYKEEKDDEYILNSSLNPDVYFTGKKDEVFDQLFKPQSYFLRKTVKQK